MLAGTGAVIFADERHHRAAKINWELRRWADRYFRDDVELLGGIKRSFLHDIAIAIVVSNVTRKLLKTLNVNVVTWVTVNIECWCRIDGIENATPRERMWHERISDYDKMVDTFLLLCYGTILIKKLINDLYVF